MTTITGANGVADFLEGTADADTISGLGGSDTLYGYAGNDSLIGGEGGDTLYGGDDNDFLSDIDVNSNGSFKYLNTLYGGDGDDTLEGTGALLGEAGADTLTLYGQWGTAVGGDGNDTLYSASTYTGSVSLTLMGGDGDDLLEFDSISGVSWYWGWGGAGSDILSGGAGSEALYGEDGDDFIEAGAGDDSLLGGAGLDTLDGGDGADYLSGGLGADSLSGGSGSDTFDFDRSIATYDDGLASYVVDDYDIVTDFTVGSGGDVLAFADLLSILGYSGSDPFGDGWLIAEQVGADTHILLDVNGGGDDFSSTIAVLQSVAGDLITTDANLSGASSYDIIADVETGTADSDVMSATSGALTLIGGDGNDIYVVDSVYDAVVEVDGEGLDLVQASVSWTLGDAVEKLSLDGTANLSGTGNAEANTLTGNTGVNTLSGLAGNDTLDGDAGADLLDGGDGDDVLIGGAGNDTYVVESASDSITESSGEGTDLVQASVSWTLDDALENLTLSGSSALTGTGNASANTLVGNSGANTLSGLDGNDSLNGGTGNDSLDGGAGNDLLTGGSGNDAMTGGAGNDTYFVDSARDTVVESSNQGTDQVSTSVAWTLGANVEYLVLTGTANIAGTGNTLANRLTGNQGNNLLDGKTGADTMTGGKGNDTYVVDNARDTVVESTNQGTDTIQSSVSYTLGSNVDYLVLTGTAGIKGTGNTLANRLTGNQGNNILDGKTGADTMTGGKGNDTYVVDNSADKVVEANNQGTDTVQASVSYTLGTAVEKLTLLGSKALNATGNSAANVLAGNSGGNTLYGAAGADTLTGGSGADKFLYKAKTEGGDTITDFKASQGDRLVLSSKAFGGVKKGTLSTASFEASKTGKTTKSGAVFVFNIKTKVLSFDANGKKSGGVVTIAKLTGASLSAAQITIVT